MPTRRKINSVRVVFVVVVCILIIAGLASVFVVKKGLSSTGNGDKNVVFTKIHQKMADFKVICKYKKNINVNFI